MRWSIRPRAQRTLGRRVPAGICGTGGHVVGLALEARLLGRFRLLTVDAIIDVSDVPSSRRSAIGGQDDTRVPSLRARRLEAESLLEGARRVLTDDQHGDAPS